MNPGVRNEALPQIALTIGYSSLIWFSHPVALLPVTPVVCVWRLPEVVKSGRVPQLVKLLIVGSLTAFILNAINGSNPEARMNAGVLASVRIILSIVMISGLTATVSRRSSFRMLLCFRGSTALAFSLLRPVTLIADFRQRLRQLSLSYLSRGQKTRNLREKLSALRVIAPTAVYGMLAVALESTPALLSKGISLDNHPRPFYAAKVGIADCVFFAAHFVFMAVIVLLNR